MGRVKSALIKRTARTLAKIGKNFEKGFDVNKKILGSSMPSKRMRNRIAGYITRIKILEEKKKVKLSKIV
jgi:ribosomal protein S17E